MSRIARILTMVVLFLIWIQVIHHLNINLAWFYLGSIIIGVLVNIVFDMISEGNEEM